MGIEERFDRIAVSWCIEGEIIGIICRVAPDLTSRADWLRRNIPENDRRPRSPASPLLCITCYYASQAAAIRKTTAISRLHYCYSRLDVIIPALAPLPWRHIILPMMWYRSNPMNDCAPTVT